MESSTVLIDLSAKNLAQYSYKQQETTEIKLNILGFPKFETFFRRKLCHGNS